MGRIYTPDERDLQYPMRAGLPSAKKMAANPLPTRKTWGIKPPVLDQGKTGTCVAQAWHNFLRCKPTQTVKTAPPAFTLYRELIIVDEYPGNDNEVNLLDDELQYGSSVRAGVKALEARGHIKQYLWAFDISTVVEWVLTKGPVVMGTNWYDSMFTKTTDGILKVEGTVAGGHAWMVRGVDTKKRLVGPCANSWGKDWGKNGEFYLSFADFERLIHEQGEACAAVEKKVIKDAA